MIRLIGSLYFFIYLFFILQEEQKELDEITAKRQKKGRNEEDAPAEEKTILHGTVARSNWDIWMADTQWNDLLMIFIPKRASSPFWR